MNKEIKFTINIDPPTKKNGSTFTAKNGKPRLIPNKKYREYIEDCGYLIPSYVKGIQIDYPVNIKTVFYRKTRRKVDITNLLSAAHDMLVEYGVITDDSSLNPCIVHSVDGSRVEYSKENPRCEFTITRIEEKSNE